VSLPQIERPFHWQTPHCALEMLVPEVFPAAGQGTGAGRLSRPSASTLGLRILSNANNHGLGCSVTMPPDMLTIVHRSCQDALTPCATAVFRNCSTPYNPTKTPERRSERHPHPGAQGLPGVPSYRQRIRQALRAPTPVYPTHCV